MGTATYPWYNPDKHALNKSVWCFITYTTRIMRIVRALVCYIKVWSGIGVIVAEQLLVCIRKQYNQA